MIAAGVAAVVLGGVFVWREPTFATPLVPTTYWRRRNFMFPMGTKSFSSFAYFGGFFLFPLLMEQVYGYSVSQVGFLSVARPLLFAISAPDRRLHDGAHGGADGDAVRHRRPSSSPWCCSPRSARRRGSWSSWSRSALSGLGMGVSMPATSATMSNELAESEYGVMSAAQLLATQVGEVAGIQAVLTIQESIARRSGLGNVHHSTALLHSFCVAVLGRRRRGRAVGGVRALHPIPAAGRPRPGAARRRRLSAAAASEPPATR